MKRSLSLRAVRESSPDPTKNLHPLVSNVLKLAKSEAEAGYFEGEKIHKNVVSTIDNSIRFLNGKFWQELQFGKTFDVIEVVAKGTKLMKSINFPTVIVKFRTENLDKATMYYATLEFEAEEWQCKVPAIMFSNPYAHKKTMVAELLPLCFLKCSRSVCFTPMLARKRYRRVFRRGFSLKVKSLVPGRAFDGLREHSWNRYDIRNTVQRNRLRGFMEMDIKQITFPMGKKIIRMKDITVRHSGLQKGVTLGQTALRSPGTVNMEKRETLNDRGPGKRFYTKDVLCNVCNRRGCICPECLKVAVPNQHRVKIFRYAKGASLSRFSVNHLNELDKYDCVSIMI